MQRLHQRHVLPLCMAYAKLEVRLGEVDRARALYVYVSQWADVREARGQKVWKAWEEFEVEHGNEETYRDMLRIKRSVASAYASVGRGQAGGEGEEAEAEVQRLMKGGLIDTGGKKKRKRHVVPHDREDTGDTAPEDVDAGDDDEEEERGEGAEGESLQEEGSGYEGSKRGRVQANPEEIDLGDLDDDEDEDEEVGEEVEAVDIDKASALGDGDDMGGLVEKPIPDSVFGL